MKQLNLILFLVLAIVFGSEAQNKRSAKNNYCDLGVTFEISSVPGWGYGEPVILKVEPYSPADKAELKPGDIIMEINGTATYLRSYQTILSWINETSSPEMEFTIRNVESYFKDSKIVRECKSDLSVSEFSLASAYSFYSIEDTNDRGFSLPLRIDPNLDVDFSDYHTFNFLEEDNNVPDIDRQVNAYIEKALLGRGLKKDTKDPDFIVQAYYTYQPNVKHENSIRVKNLKTWRYDSDSKDMIQLPLLSADDPNAESKGKYILELGIRFFDKRNSENETMIQIWDCKSREFLTEDFDLKEYTRIHAPLMMMQFPYSTPKSKAKYVVSYKKFNYTGINFDTDNMSRIGSVNIESPAAAAGIKAGDIVQKINGIRFGYTMEELESGYRRFIVESMALRDKRTRFIDANGFPDCMHWSKNRYEEVAALVNKQDLYNPSFSYLYSFEKYMPGAGNNVLEVELKTQNGEQRILRVKPEIQESVVVRAL